MTSATEPPARILVIEDDPSGSVSMQRILSRAGHEVTLATTCADGLKKIAASTFELVVIDKNLTDGDGIRMLKNIRLSHPHQRAIVITAYPKWPDPNRGARPGRAGLFDQAVRGQRAAVHLLHRAQPRLGSAACGAQGAGGR